MALSWNTIHIFNFGQTQLIGKKLNKIFLSSTITSLQPLTANIWSLRPNTFIGMEEYNIITLLNGIFVDFSSNPIITSPNNQQPIQSYRIDITELDQTLLGNFITELTNLVG